MLINLSRQDAFLILLWAQILLPGPLSADENTPPCCEPSARYSRSFAIYDVPAGIELIDQNGERQKFRSLSGPGPMVLQFGFTSCTTVCPAMSAAMAEASRKLGPAAEHVRFVMVSIDPEQDTPQRLRKYAESLELDERWALLTGSPRTVRRLQDTFDAGQQNKARHEPLTFLYSPDDDKKWVRLNGFLSSKELALEIEAILPESDP